MNTRTSKRDEGSVIDVQRLSVTFGDDGNRVFAVRDATFTVGPGEKVAIVGESGSGKSTLALAIAGLLTTTIAHVVAEKMQIVGIAGLERPIRRVPFRTPGVSMIFQDAMTSLDPVATIASQFSAVLRGVDRVTRKDARAETLEWLGRVGLHEGERILGARSYQLSGGMRQRVMVALALCSRPRVLLADEPTSALDASISRQVMDLMSRIAVQDRISLLIISHDIGLCREYADRIIVMRKGEIVDVCSARSLREEATHPYTTALLECVPTFENARCDFLPTLNADLTINRSGRRTS